MGKAQSIDIGERMVRAMYDRLLGEQRYEGVGWLVGWRNVKFPERGILNYTGIAKAETGRKYERYYGMPIHRILDGRPRALTWEMDLWMINFARLLKEAINGGGLESLRSGEGAEKLRASISATTARRGYEE